MEFKIGIYT